jgi:SAM-dependent methyltransferase
LLYLNPRPSALSYQKFYEEGGDEDSVYHRRNRLADTEKILKLYFGDEFSMDPRQREALEEILSHGKRKADSHEKRKADQKGELSIQTDDNKRRVKIDYYGKYIYDLLKRFVPQGGKVFEVGASSGKLLVPWKVFHDCQVSGVEPKKAAVLTAKEHRGIELFDGFADDPRIPEGLYDLVMNTRTINHMLDPLRDLRYAWRWLKRGGVLFVDIQDAIREAQYEGFERSVVEIDHPYMFSLNTLCAMVQKAGFEIIERELVDLQRARDWDERAPEVKQIHIIARKGEPPSVTYPDPLEELGALVRSQLAFERTSRHKRDEKRRKGHSKVMGCNANA